MTTPETLKKGLKPLVKWVGGKRRMLATLHEHIPKSFGTYYEPFVGGGALWLSLLPQKAVITDSNEELINLYQVVRLLPDALIIELKAFENTESCFYKVREWDRDNTFNVIGSAKRAARFLYLNKTAFNGLYRVNSKGEFNAPFGKYANPKWCNKSAIMGLSDYLNQNAVFILNADYRRATTAAQKNDFVYFDPPYARTKNGSFTSYTSEKFGEAQQCALAKVCQVLNLRGVMFLQSNANTPLIRELYKDFNIIEVENTRTVGADVRSRGKVKELLIKNY